MLWGCGISLCGVWEVSLRVYEGEVWGSGGDESWVDIMRAVNTGVIMS